MKHKKLLFSYVIITYTLAVLGVSSLFTKKNIPTDIYESNSISAVDLSNFLYDKNGSACSSSRNHYYNNDLKHVEFTIGNTATLYLYNDKKQKLIKASNVDKKEKSQLLSNLNQTNNLNHLSLQKGDTLYSRYSAKRLAKISDAYYLSPRRTHGYALSILDNSNDYLKKYHDDIDTYNSYRGKKKANMFDDDCNYDHACAFDNIDNMDVSHDNWLTKYDINSLNHYEWHPATFVRTKATRKLNPVIYFSENGQHYFLPLTKFEHDWYFEIDNNHDEHYQYFIKVKDVIYANRRTLTVNNAPMFISKEIDKDPYNYALHYVKPSKSNYRLKSNAPAGRIIDEQNMIRNAKYDPNVALSITKAFNAVKQNARLDNADDNKFKAQIQTVNDTLTNLKSCNLSTSFGQIMPSDYENSHLLYRTFGYALLDPKPFYYNSRSNYYYQGYVFNDEADMEDDTKPVKNDRAYIKTGLFKKQPLNGKNGLHHGLYILFDNIDNNEQIVYPKYPVGKQIYLQSIVKNSLPNRGNEYYFIARYNEKVKGGYRQWIYPVLPDKNVRISSIVNHKQIATHYNNFMDTAILGYHMLDHDRYHEFDNKYELKKYIYNKCLPSIDTASENLAQEQN